MRRCLVSGEVLPKTELIRFVVGPDDSIVPDLDAILPGRGLWLSARRDMVETAARKKSFSRAARRQVAVPPDLAERVEMQLRRRCLDRIGMARRAGAVTAGFDKVRAAAKAKTVAMLFEAAEGAEDGRRKIAALVPEAPICDWFTGAELAAVLGREHVVHVALLTGKEAQRSLTLRLKQDLNRLGRYAGLGEPPPQGGTADGNGLDAQDEPGTNV